MPYVTAEAIEAARQIDLLTYLRTQEPGELVHVSGNTYCTREHDSLKISNGKWHWFSRGIGGRNALDYLVKVKEMSFPDAVSLLTGTPPQSYTAPKEPVIPKERRLLLPDVDTNCDTVKQYLDGRGIHATVVDYCIEKKILFQTAQYKNALFVGYDQMGKPRYGALRSTFSRYKAEATGSDKHYSFQLWRILTLIPSMCSRRPLTCSAMLRWSFTRASTGSRMRCCLWPGCLLLNDRAWCRWH